MNAVDEQQMRPPNRINRGTYDTNKRRPTAAAAQSHPRGTPRNRRYSSRAKERGRGKGERERETVGGEKSGATLKLYLSKQLRLSRLSFPRRCPSRTRSREDRLLNNI